MKSSKFHKLVTLVSNTSDDLCYRLNCMCGEHENAVFIDWVIDKEDDVISMIFTKDFEWSHWCDGWGNKIKERIDIAIKVLLGQSIRFTEEFVMFPDGVEALEEIIADAKELMADRLEVMNKERVAMGWEPLTMKGVPIEPRDD